jgi:hypothetical protein
MKVAHFSLLSKNLRDLRVLCGESFQVVSAFDRSKLDGTISDHYLQ